MCVFGLCLRKNSAHVGVERKRSVRNLFVREAQAIVFIDKGEVACRGSVQVIARMGFPAYKEGMCERTGCTSKARDGSAFCGTHTCRSIDCMNGVLFYKRDAYLHHCLFCRRRIFKYPCAVEYCCNNITCKSHGKNNLRKYGESMNL